MKICFIPIDNRPVCYNLAKEIVSIDGSIELLIPPKNLLGNLKKNADIFKLLHWLEQIPKCDSIIISLDTIAYGGLIPSRKSMDSFEEISERLELLKKILASKNAKIYAFSSIMRISNNNINEEEKSYWNLYGEKIFEYSYKFHKDGVFDSGSIPKVVLLDYLNTRKRNLEINKLYLEWQKEGFFEKLIFSKDDCAEYGINVMEAIELESMGGEIKTGADEIPLVLLARALEKSVKVYIEYTEPLQTYLISNYEDISISKSVSNQLKLGGFTEVFIKNDADLVLYVNNFKEKQGEHVIDIETEEFNGKFVPYDMPYAVADVRFANGADNKFTKQVLDTLHINNFYGYSAWNTSSNSLGSLLAFIKFKYNASKYNELEFKKSQVIRFLDDWAYQANIRKEIQKPCNIDKLMLPYEKILENTFNLNLSNCKYTYPWDRKFEIEVSLC